MINLQHSLGDGTLRCLERPNPLPSSSLPKDINTQGIGLFKAPSVSLAGRSIELLSSLPGDERELPENESLISSNFLYPQKEEIVETFAHDGTIVRQYKSVRDFFDGLYEQDQDMPVSVGRLFSSLSPTPPFDEAPHFINPVAPPKDEELIVEADPTNSTLQSMELHLVSPLDDLIERLNDSCLKKMNLFTNSRLQGDYTINPFGYKDPRRNVLLAKCAIVRGLRDLLEPFDLSNCSFSLEMSRKLLALGEGINEVVDWLDKTHLESKVTQQKIRKFADEFEILVLMMKNSLPEDEFSRSTVSQHAEKAQKKKPSKRPPSDDAELLSFQPSKKAKRGAKN